jgi:flagellar basal-body rod protein FlgG
VGIIKHTGRCFDLAIRGDGFFQIMTPEGKVFYTRHGSFHLDGSRGLVTKEGYAVVPQITFPSNVKAVRIDRMGSVQIITFDNERTCSAIGQIQLVRFPNPDGLLKEEKGYFSESRTSGPPVLSPAGVQMGYLQQGYLESRPRGDGGFR